MKLLVTLFTLFITGVISLYTVLHNGSLVAYLDAHPDSRWVPQTEYFIGEGYYIFGRLQNSATFYQRVADRYPSSSYADDAFWGYLQALDDMNTPRPQMVEAYAKYLERFPNGFHAEIVKKRSEYAQNGR